MIITNSPFQMAHHYFHFYSSARVTKWTGTLGQSTEVCNWPFNFHKGTRNLSLAVNRGGTCVSSSGQSSPPRFRTWYLTKYINIVCELRLFFRMFAGRNENGTKLCVKILDAMKSLATKKQNLGECILKYWYLLGVPCVCIGLWAIQIDTQFHLN